MLPGAVVRAEGHISMGADGGWLHVRDGVPEPLEVPKSQVHELRMLTGLRDTVVTLLEAEATTPLPGDLPTVATLPKGPSAVGEERMTALRERLNRQYDAYVKRYGPINRVTSRNTGRIDPKTGEPVLAQVRPRQGGFRGDPHSPAVFALEHYDSATGTARKADIFTERVVAPRVVRTRADSPADAGRCVWTPTASYVPARSPGCSASTRRRRRPSWRRSRSSTPTPSSAPRTAGRPPGCHARTSFPGTSVPG